MVSRVPQNRGGPDSTRLPTTPPAPTEAHQDGGYRPADQQGNFPGAVDDDDAADVAQRRIDYDEFEMDPSERIPGGPLAQAVNAVSPQLYKQKWWFPAAVFLIASLLQSIGLFSATRRYVQWMGNVEKLYDKELVNNEKADTAQRWSLDKIGPRDNFANWMGRETTSKGAVELVAAMMPFVWCYDCTRMRNIRLWARTLFAASLLALLKGLFAWATVVPDSSGWESCRQSLNPQVFGIYRSDQPDGSVLNVVKAVPIIIWIWIKNLICGMRLQKDLVCPNSFSGPSYLATVFALAIFDAQRTKARKLKHTFRLCAHMACGSVLSFIVLAEAFTDIRNRRQYTIDVVLALAFSMLIYTSPVVAIAVDNFMLKGAPRQHVESKENYDVGDVIIPPCCFPFCFFHGRYFIYTKSAAEVEEARQAQFEATRVAEQFRVEEEENARQLLELEAHLESLRQRLQVRERQEAVEAEKRLVEQLTDMQMAHEKRVARQLASLETMHNNAENATKQLEENVVVERRRLEELTTIYASEERRLLIEIARRQDQCDGATSDISVEGDPPVAGADIAGGDFRSAPPYCWSAIHTRFRVHRLTECSADVAIPMPLKVKDVCLADVASPMPWKVKDVDVEASSGLGDFRSLSNESWFRIHSRFEQNQNNVLLVAGGNSGEVATSPATSSDQAFGGLGDFRLLPSDSWLRLHSRFTHTFHQVAPTMPAASTARVVWLAELGVAPAPWRPGGSYHLLPSVGPRKLPRKDHRRVP